MIVALRRGSCQLWWASAAADHPALLELLDHRERARHSRFVRASDRSLFAVSHALTRIVAGHHAGTPPQALLYAPPPQPGAKPRFAGSAPQFSLSHSGERVVLAVSWETPIGVDLERIDPRPPEPSLLAAALTAGERRALAATPAQRRAWAFSRYWTRKEALLKASGDGLAVPPHRIAVSAPAQAPALLAWADPRRPAAALHLYDLRPADGYCAALATLAAPLRPSDHDGDALLGAWR